MSTRLASFVLAATTVVSSYVMLLIGDVLPKFIFSIFHLRAPSDLAILMPPITQFAARFSWAFALAVALVCIVVVILLRQYPARLLQLLAIGLSTQALVVWFGMFCYCYLGLTGSMSLHHDSHFEFAQFFQFAFGVFPVTLCAILIPGFYAVLSPKERSA